MTGYLPHFLLPLPDGALPLKINLALVDRMETAGGGLFAAAEALVAKQLPLGQVLRILGAAYTQAGCRMDSDNLHEFLMASEPALLLTRLMSAVLSPLADMGITDEGGHAGERAPAQAG